jgi:pimeloyl-ACP methyl ester carboxylesterase
MTQITANGLELEYDEFGAVDAPAILLIMGLGTQMTAWSAPFCERLAGHGFRVIRFDNRDVGLSSKFHDQKAPGMSRFMIAKFLGLSLRLPYMLDDMADDAVGLLDALRIDESHIVGASMGGMIAQLIAGRFPDRCISLTSIMSSSGDPSLPGPSAEIRKQLLAPRPDASQPEAAVQRTVRGYQLLGSPGFRRTEEELRQLAQDSIERSYYPQGIMRQVAAIVANGSRVDLLKRIRIPTLVIHGLEDPLVPVACGKHTAGQIENACLELIEGMGHDLPPQLTDRLVDLIANHAKKVTPAQEGFQARGA